jgi:hypothetical protein
MFANSAICERLAESDKGAERDQDGYFNFHNPGQRHLKK